MRLSKEYRASGIRRILCELSPNHYVVEVDIQMLQIDPDLQRKLDKRHVAQMLALRQGPGGENRAAFAATLLVLNYRTHGKIDKRLFVCDGNHRRDMYEHLGQRYVLCEVFIGLSREEEAELFYLRNGGKNSTKRMNGWIRFRAALNANENPEVAMQAIVAECGLTTPINAHDGQADITSTSILTELYMKKGRSAEFMRRVLNLLKKGWSEKGRLVGSANNVQTLRGFSSFIENNPQITDRTILAKMKSHFGSAGNINKVALDIANHTGKTRADVRQVREALEQVMALGEMRLTA